MVELIARPCTMESVLDFSTKNADMFCWASHNACAVGSQ